MIKRIINIIYLHLKFEGSFKTDFLIAKFGYIIQEINIHFEDFFSQEFELLPEFISLQSKGYNFQEIFLNLFTVLFNQIPTQEFQVKFHKLCLSSLFQNPHFNGVIATSISAFLFLYFINYEMKQFELVYNKISDLFINKLGILKLNNLLTNLSFMINLNLSDPKHEKMRQNFQSFFEMEITK